MRKAFLLFFCLLVSSLLHAENRDSVYRPLVEEGKHWTYDHEDGWYYHYDLKGDTLIAGKNCLKLYSDNKQNVHLVSYEGALYEENKKVYCFFPEKDDAELLYDFDCEVGDTLHNLGGPGWEAAKKLYEYGLAVVKDIRTEYKGGIAVKKYTLKPVTDKPWLDDDLHVIIWFEGVGATGDFFVKPPLQGSYTGLYACELKGEKLYQYVMPDLTEEGYHKMGIDGKRWNYIHYYKDEDGEHRDPYSYVVTGDSVFRRTTFKKLVYQDEKSERFVCLLYETGRTVYKTANNPLSAFFQFERDDFGRIFTWEAVNSPGNTNWMVYGVDTIEVKGRPFRRFTCLQKYSGEGEELTSIAYDGEGVWHDIWVEGVGSASSGIEDQNPLHEPPVRTSDDYTYFVSCYENGECIFTADDFTVQTSIIPVMTSVGRKGDLFDLQGRRLSGKPSRGVYIENGKKRVAK